MGPDSADLRSVSRGLNSANMGYWRPLRHTAFRSGARPIRSRHWRSSDRDLSRRCALSYYALGGGFIDSEPCLFAYRRGDHHTHSIGVFGLLALTIYMLIHLMM